MQPFLHEVAQDIITKFGNSGDYCIIFPNKRTETFFKKYFAQIIGKSSWAPNIYSIDKLLSKFSGIKTKDKISLLIDLYEIAKEVYSKSENLSYFSYFTFNKFYSIGELFLNDFNDIDNYLVDAKNLFRNIKSIEEVDLYYSFLDEYQKEIIREFWMSFSTEKTSEEKERFLKLWENLPEIYEKFTTQLLKNKITYGGLRNRHLKSLIDQNKVDTSEYSKYIFVGFNALNKAEKVVFRFLKNQNKAVFYWDYDKYYTEDLKQEAGFFMRPNLIDFPEQISENKVFINNPDKNFQLIGVPLKVGQAKIIKSILSELEKNDADYYNKTAIVLADEHLLFPVLHSLPENIKSINITMGYPLKETTLYGLLIDYIGIQQNFSSNQQKKSFYYKDVIKILKHPEIWEISKNSAQQIITDIQENNRIYIKPQYFTDFNSELFNLIFYPVCNSEQPVKLLLTNILNILYAIFSKSEKKAVKKIENEYIYQVYVEIKKLRDIIETNLHRVDFSYNISVKLLKQILSAIRIPFTGEHSDGLQIMGLMETRNLDFENVIILGVNEGIIPDTGRKPSFISDSLRIAFELPVLKFQDSIFAYFFYRILQRSQNISLLYNSITGNNSGERSRFIQQLIHESKLKIVERQFKQDLKPSLKQSILISKNEHILNVLNFYVDNKGDFGKRFSASALNTYIDCSLKFYFRYVAKLKPKTEVEEEISPATFGKILHSVMENLYKDLSERKSNKLIEKSDFEALYSHVNEYTENAFKNEFKSSENSGFKLEGTNIIVKDVVVQHVNNILKIDSFYAPFEILNVENENEYQAKIDFNLNENVKTANLTGVFDRVDCKNNIYRIIDYKTGSAEKSFQSIESLFNQLNTNRQTAVFQMLFYSYIFDQKFPKLNGKFFPGIYNIREMQSDNFSSELTYKPDRNEKTNVDCKTTSELLTEFSEKLADLLSEIFNIEIPFVQTDNNITCSYCDYKEICNR